MVISCHNNLRFPLLSHCYFSQGFKGYEAGVSYTDKDVVVTSKINEKDVLEVRVS